ncbi:MAG TPA: hypothetical protein VFH88_13525, partial [Candidatus Krumholzibacteria bacterium]|nr:hypothetical protein [Candidatus Krumholzibacteria bacterium]
ASRVEDGFAAMHTGVMGYFADHANVPPASLSGETIAAWLDARHVSAERVTDVRRVIAACEMARYAAATATVDNGRAVLKTARDALAAIEKEIA